MAAALTATGPQHDTGPRFTVRKRAALDNVDKVASTFAINPGREFPF